MRMRWLAALMLLPAACGIPRDPEGTLERVRGGVMRVGITANDPWTIAEGPSGVEVALTEELAGDLDAEIDWVEGGHAELFSALEQRELDLVIGGFAADDPWGSKVTFTQPYFTVRTLVGVAPGSLPPGDLEGVRVAVEEDSEAVHVVTQNDAIPVEVSSLEEAEPPIVAEEWEIRALRLQPAEPVLDESQRVMATPLGENAWLVRIERFLRSGLSRIPELLVEHGR
ncbi:MAG: transporter substrate-binding domain-containing protein [Actinomycetota bacterium]